jgi:hypothetical protein
MNPVRIATEIHFIGGLVKCEYYLVGAGVVFAPWPPAPGAVGVELVPEGFVPVVPDGVVALPVPPPWVPGVVEVPPGLVFDVGGMSVVPVGVVSPAHPDSIPADNAAPIRMTTHFFIAVTSPSE